jgi:hypothetical protein
VVIANGIGREAMWRPLGHGRYLIEAVGRELRQYIVVANNEERPFTPRPASVGVRLGEEGEQLLRVRHRTDNDVEYTAGYPVSKHRTFGRAVPPSAPMAAHEVELPCAKVIGAARGRPGVFPALQFETDPQTGRPYKQIRGLDRVFAALAPNLHPVAVAGFLRTPHPDLALQGRPVHPLEWLQSGGHGDPVFRLMEAADWASR